MTNFHERLKSLRKAREMTQEQLAEYMGVSPQAVSRWETGATCPDISQIPLLSYIFDVSADVLLGIDTKRVSDAIRDIAEQAACHTQRGDHQSAAGTLRAGLAQFPRSYQLMTELAVELSCVGGDKTLTDEIVTLCEKVIAECTDNEWRDKALQTLIFRYKNSGEREKAALCAARLSPVWCSREDMMIAVYDEDAQASDLRGYVSFCADRLMMCLAMLSRKEEYTAEDQKQLLRSAAAIANAIYEDGDANYYAHHLVSVWQALAQHYAAETDADNTLTALNELCRYAVLFDTYGDDEQCTSPAVRGEEHGRPIPIGETMRERVSKTLADKAYDFVREDPRFITTRNTLR